MAATKIYVQPLGLLRGLTVTSPAFTGLAGSDINFSALRIFSREQNGIKEEIVAVTDLQQYLSDQPGDIRAQIEALIVEIVKDRPALKLKGDLTLSWDKPVIQGVLNVTPDSFSDGGQYDDVEKSVVFARQMISAGADIIDIGGETTRPGAKAVSIDVEKERVVPVIEKLSGADIPISIDSRNAGVMSAAISAGAHMVNDVSALCHDQFSVNIVKESGVPVILMHAQGNPETMQDNPEYENVLLDIYDYLEARIEFCQKAGISKDRIIVDPGIGFGKTLTHNLQLIEGLTLFHALGVPLLVGVSRKSFIGKLSGEEIAAKRVSGSIAAMLLCLDKGAQIVRVHDVEQSKQAISVWHASCM